MEVQCPVGGILEVTSPVIVVQCDLRSDWLPVDQNLGSLAGPEADGLVLLVLHGAVFRLDTEPVKEDLRRGCGLLVANSTCSYTKSIQVIAQIKNR